MDHHDCLPTFAVLCRDRTLLIGEPTRFGLLLAVLSLALAAIPASLYVRKHVDVLFEARFGRKRDHIS